MANDKRASSDLADSLHALVFETLIEQITAYRTQRYDEEGKPLPLEPVPPALLAQALKALKDNGIDSPVRAKKLQDALAGAMPSLDDVDDEHMGAPN